MPERVARIVRICVMIVLAHAFVGCAPSIQREGYIVTPSEKEVDCEVSVVKQEEFHAETGTVLGTMKVGDSGFSTKCKEADVLRLLRSEACKLGAQVIVLRDIKPPSFFGSSCYRVTADFVSLSDTTAMHGLQHARSDSRDDFLASTPDSVQRWVTEHEMSIEIESAMRYHYFTDESMNEAYKQTYGLYFNSVMHVSERTRWAGGDAAKTDKSIIRPEFGILFAAGHPLQEDTDWQVVKSDLSMIVWSIGGTGIYEFDATGKKSFVPYIGLGMGFFLGFERIDVHAFKQLIGGEMHYEWHDTCYRHSFSGHAALGATLKHGDRFSWVGEIRWTQAGKGRLKRMKVSEKELAEGWGEAFEDFQHPDFNFTGPSVSIGVRW